MTIRIMTLRIKITLKTAMMLRIMKLYYDTQNNPNQVITTLRITTLRILMTLIIMTFRIMTLGKMIQNNDTTQHIDTQNNDT
jgi:hypothetical protein